MQARNIAHLTPQLWWNSTLYIYGPKRLFKVGEKRPIVCYGTHEQKMKGLLKMVAMATSHSLLR